MSYVLRADVEVEIPPAFLTQALDDDGDGVEDAGLWAAVVGAVDAEVDGFLSRRYPLPLAEVPASLRAGACVLACEKVHGRRGAHGDKNPWTKRAGDFRKFLEALAKGDAALEVGRVQARPPVSIVSEQSGTVPRRRLNG
jgi:phage gp36-like protein